MTVDEARSLLDRVKGGGTASSQEIRRALFLTGDLSMFQGDHPIRILRPAGSWELADVSQLRRAEPFDGLAA